ncbi:MAG TPA: hypothetical protein VFQ53_32535 [Kofleriaceae bacterium]|nr:hypothetical protein [Kofleriaceae bacterium]
MPALLVHGVFGALSALVTDPHVSAATEPAEVTASAEATLEVTSRLRLVPSARLDGAVWSTSDLASRDARVLPAVRAELAVTAWLAIDGEVRWSPAGTLAYAGMTVRDGEHFVALRGGAHADRFVDLVAGTTIADLDVALAITTATVPAWLEVQTGDDRPGALAATATAAYRF